MTTATMLASLAVGVLACLAAWRLVTPLSLIVYLAVGGRRTASGTVIWCLRQERLALAARRAGRRQL